MVRINGFGSNDPPEFDGAEEQDFVEELLRKFRRSKGKRHSQLAQTLERGGVTQPMPASSYIERRRQGLWGKNRNDQAAFDTAKWTEDLAHIIAQVPMNTTRIAVHSFDVATRADEYMNRLIAALPEELQEDAETFAAYLAAVVKGTGLESTKMYPEIANKVIAKMYKDMV